MPEHVLLAEGLTKIYKSAGRDLVVLDDVSFSAGPGTTLSIIGPSGSGKTTLLGLCAGLDVPSRGTVSLMGFKLNAMSEDDRAYIRNQYVGFVFQNFQLLQTLTALENVMVPLELRGEKNVSKRAEELLSRVGLAERLDHYPSQLSLDEENANHVTELLFGMNRAEGTTLVLVTHNLELAQRTERILQMKGGRVVEQKDMVKV
jgi:putative ABC transport system ATP-binding protein